MSSTNAKIWNSHGVPAASHAQCDAAMVPMLSAIKKAGPLADIVFAEAKFQIYELLSRTESFRRLNEWSAEETSEEGK